MKIGDIVTLNEITFTDGRKDNKNNRPCIFLLKEIIDDKQYAYIMPLTSKVRRFNKNSDRYIFIPEIIYNYKKLSFAKIDGIICVPIEQLKQENKRLTTNTIKNVCKRIKEYNTESTRLNTLIQIRELLNNEEYKVKKYK